ncbi:STAS-like domain-containing protein [Methylobacterium pseudosasicola]|uniref:DUF4325 domain-containing protein n=1 Tax=Methylobacterium pseudosasicola TaxID=582667 RepID=A0A1I4SB45_9HYPH|nr:STAS-like domain-containing protein [Methylobacterium pseudosasicola]SFM61685.1 protein of unknown function [Methylobacterium pseudosasicola]
MINLNIFEIVGSFGEDKDAAARLREAVIKPTIQGKEEIIIDFLGVTLVTQSFIHALISDVLRTNGEDALDFMDFKNCDAVVKGIISTVIQYSLDTMDAQI